MNPVIHTSALTKNFGTTRALDGLDLEVRQGEVLGLLGPNGASKSATLRILLGQLRKSGGDAEVFGSAPWTKAVDLHQRVAYIPDDVELWPSSRGRPSSSPATSWRRWRSWPTASQSSVTAALWKLELSLICDTSLALPWRWN
ncbi:ATP-binding cassette domain-containing protein [Actinomyces minihominis]|uniref:ATP-binding cassette domain-containing protein n=1 Tax=Actinomyces minihominis TaxID=2002838 RepID=UPI000C075299|nr:ATP-binding cassette domain-containing protein [Actinomyces minihominis]